MPDFPKPYWSEWSDRIITRYSLREGPPGEFHGACPSCGHNDWPSTRFWINEKDGLVKFACRQCNDFAAIVAEMEHDGVWPIATAQPGVMQHRVTAADFANVVPMPKAEPEPTPDEVPAKKTAAWQWLEDGKAEKEAQSKAWKTGF